MSEGTDSEGKQVVPTFKRMLQIIGRTRFRTEMDDVSEMQRTEAIKEHQQELADAEQEFGARTLTERDEKELTKEAKEIANKVKKRKVGKLSDR